MGMKECCCFRAEREGNINKCAALAPSAGWMRQRRTCVHDPNRSKKGYQISDRQTMSCLFILNETTELLEEQHC